MGKAQEVVSSLLLEKSMQYKCSRRLYYVPMNLCLRPTVKFRNHKKTSEQIFVEFAREKGVLFDKWCEVKDSFESL